MAPPIRRAVSPTMLKALGMARDAGLERRKGGFWTYPGCPSRRVERDDVPDAYVDIRTIDACVFRGLLERLGPGYDAPARLTEAGRALMPDDAPEVGAGSAILRR